MPFLTPNRQSQRHRRHVIYLPALANYKVWWSLHTGARNLSSVFNYVHGDTLAGSITQQPILEKPMQSPVIYKNQLLTLRSMANAQVDAQCDKLAPELSWRRFASKVANFQLSYLHLAYPTCIWHLRWGWPRLGFAESFSIRKLESLGYHVAFFAWSYV